MAKYRFDEIAFNITEKKKPVEEDKYTYLGLEHLDSGSLKVTRFGSDVAPIGEKLIMKKGDVLFGKRRAYQKKVAIAPFDGIFSAHGMVLRPKEEVIDKRFFPLFISSDYFLDAAIQISVGSLSPTINWRDLKALEFELPPLEEQKKLAEVLWSINETLDAYKKLLKTTDQLVKSQFIEMFGETEKNRFGYPVLKISDIATCYPGATPSTKVDEYWNGGTIPWMSSGEVHKKHVYDTDQRITQEGYDHASTRMVPAHSIVIALAGQGKTRGTVAINEIELCTNQSLCAIIPDTNRVLVEYLFYNLDGRYEELRNMSTNVGGRGGLSLTIVNKIPVIIPPMEQQREYVEIVKQSDKSKFELEQSIVELTATYKKIISENLG